MEEANDSSTVNEEQLKSILESPSTMEKENTESSSSDTDKSGAENSVVAPLSAAEAKKPKKKQKRTEADSKTATARKSGKALVKKVNKYVAKTGANAFLKIEYRNKSAHFQYDAGSPWQGMMEEPASQTVAIDLKAVKDAVFEGVKESVGQLLPQQPGPSSSMGSSLSPQKRPLEDGSCWVCSNKEFVLHSLCYSVQWIGCSIENCPNFVHDVCLSMPGLTETDIEHLEDVYCPNHLITGLTLKKVKSRLSVAAEKGQTSVAKRGRPTKQNK